MTVRTPHATPRQMNARLVLCLISSLCVVCCMSQGAYAQSARSMAVLNIEGEGVDRDTADTLSAVVRSEAQQIAEYQVVNSTPINLSEVVVLLGCDVTDISCLDQAAEQLDASTIVYGSIVKESARYRLRLVIFDAENDRISHRMQETIKGDGDLVYDARQEIEKFFQNIRKEQIAAKLTISSNVRGATVLLNGKESGTTPLDQLSVPPGQYTITVRKEGFTEWSAELEFGERANMKLRAPLKKQAAESKDIEPGTSSKDPVVANPERIVKSGGTQTGGSVGEELDVRKSRKGVNVGAVSLLSIGGISLIASGLVAAQMNALSDDLKTRANNGTLTPSERTAGIDRGLGLQRTHRVLLGVGAVGVAAGGIWLFTGMKKSEETVQWSVSPTGISGTYTW